MMFVRERHLLSCLKRRNNTAGTAIKACLDRDNRNVDVRVTDHIRAAIPASTDKAYAIISAAIHDAAVKANMRAPVTRAP